MRRREVKLSAVGESGKFCAAASSQILRYRRRRQMKLCAFGEGTQWNFFGIFLAVKAKPSSVDHTLLIGYCIISLPNCCARSREDDFYWRFESGLKRQDCRREHVHLILPSGKIAKAVEITVKLKLSNSDTVIIDAMTNSEFLRTVADGLSESRK